MQINARLYAAFSRKPMEATKGARGVVLTQDAAPLVGVPLTSELYENYRAILDFSYCT